MFVDDVLVNGLIEAYNRQNPSDMVSYLADTAKAVWMDLREENKEEIKNSFNWFFSVFPDATLSVDLFMSQENNSLVELTFKGTHKGELFGIQPTNKAVTCPMVWILAIKDKKISSWREYFNPEPLLNQLKN